MQEPKLPYRLNKDQRDFLKEQYRYAKSLSKLFGKRKTAKGVHKARKQVLAAEQDFWKNYSSLVSEITRMEIAKKYTIDSADSLSAFAVLTDYVSCTKGEYSYITLYFWRPEDRLVRFGPFRTSENLFERHLKNPDIPQNISYNSILTPVSSKCG